MSPKIEVDTGSARPEIHFRLLKNERFGQYVSDKLAFDRAKKDMEKNDFEHAQKELTTLIDPTETSKLIKAYKNGYSYETVYSRSD